MLASALGRSSTTLRSRGPRPPHRITKSNSLVDIRVSLVEDDLAARGVEAEGHVEQVGEGLAYVLVLVGGGEHQEEAPAPRAQQLTPQSAMPPGGHIHVVDGGRGYLGGQAPLELPTLVQQPAEVQD